MRRATLVAAAAVLVACGGLAAGTAGPAAGSATPSQAPSYVALGDSYTSGPGLAIPLGPGSSPPVSTTCLRSSQNYPSRTARALGLELTDVSCAGATTGDLTGSQGGGIPPQLSAVGPTTSVVTVGIGGNDLGYSTIAANCAAMTPWGPTRVGWSCARHYGEGSGGGLVAGLRRVGTKVAAVLDDIRARAHRARVFVIGYPEIIPSTGTGCWPSLPFSRDDVGFLRGVEEQLNATLAQDALAAGDTYVDMAAPSASHSACAPAGARWVEPVLSPPHTYPLHPTAAGMAGMAAILEDAIRGGGTR